MIVYLSRKNLSLKKFIVNCLIVNAIWTPSVVYIGWLAGKGFIFALEIIKNLETVTTIFVIIVILTIIIKKKVETRLLNTKPF
jgi:membrane protein DedA with SNARE-associated domain